MSNRIGIIAALTLTSIAVFPACRATGGSGTSSEAAPFVQDYLELADAAAAETTTVDEEFLADALRKLAAAVGTLNLGDVELQSALRVGAEHVVSNPERLDTTVAVRNSLVSAAEAIEAGGTSGGTGVRQSAESLRPDRPLLDQTATIREFLSRSGAALRRAAADDIGTRLGSPGDPPDTRPSGAIVDRYTWSSLSSVGARS